MQQLNARRLFLVAFTVVVWSLVLLGSSPGAGDSLTMRLLREWFHLEGQTLETVNFVLRKSIHVLYYGTLSFLIMRSLLGWLIICPWRVAVWGAALALITGMLDELHQSQFITRTGTPVDLVYDGIGILLAICLHAFLVVRRTSIQH